MTSPSAPPPSSRQPAASPSAGNAKYAIVAVVLLLAVGGILYYSQRPVPAPVTIPSVAPGASSVATVNPKEEDVPPPPPPEVKPAPGKSGVVTGGLPAGGCEGKCGGSSPPELAQALQVRAAQARRCYNQALTQDNSLRGHVSIAVRVGPSGNVCSATVAANDMGTPSVANCAANIFRSSGTLPAPRGGCIDANVPMSFVPQGQ